jgi:hypothetical protein
MRRFTFFTVLWVLTAVSAAWAAEDDSRFALVLGNAAYDGDAALANSANDASDIANALSAIGWKVTKLINGDRKQMNRTIAEFRDAMSAAKNPTALLYYAGHGIQIGGQNYLIPVKETFETTDDVVNDAISLSSIQSAFDDAKVSTNIIILDACRDNPFVKKNTRSLGGTRGLSVVQKSSVVEGSAVLFATAPGDTAADGTGRNGVFTQALLKYINTDISLQVLAARVTGEVKRLTGGKQTPYSSLSLSDEFFLVPASMRTDAPVPATVAPAAVAPAPQADPNQAVRASLVVQKETLVTQKREVQAKGSWAGILGGVGWATALAGAGLTGYSWYSGMQAGSDYNAATTQPQFDGARAKLATANSLFTVGLAAAGGGLVVGVISLFLGPDTGSIDRQIQDVDHKLTLLGAP